MRTIILIFTLLLAIACGNKNTVVSEYEKLPEHFIVNELIVQLEPNIETRVLETQFSDQELVLKEELSVHMRAYLFRFNDQLIIPQKMIEMVRNFKGVSTVEFNKKMAIRE